MNSMGEKTERIIVLDTAAILSLQLERIGERYITSEGVVKEVRYGNLAPERLEAALLTGSIEVLTPSPRFIDEVRRESENTGDLQFLSKTDLEILALALELKTKGHEVKIATDDYGIQNTAYMLGIETIGIRHPKAGKPVKWILRCKVCKRTLEKPVNTCPFCGGEVAKQPVKR